MLNTASDLSFIQSIKKFPRQDWRVGCEKEHFTHLAAIQYIISWTDGEVQAIYRVWSLQAADGAIGEGCVIYCHASIDRDVAQAQQRWTL